MTFLIEAPSKWLLLGEFRSGIESRLTKALFPWLLAISPKGDGHPVIVLPGLGGTDASTYILRDFLTKLGYTVEPWGLGRNRGLNGAIAVALGNRLRTVYSKHGNRKVSLIGWSMGGLFARELAKLDPPMVRQVITMGTPFKGDATNANLAYRLLSGETTKKSAEKYPNTKIKPPVPFTSIYSRSDGIVSWRCSVEEETETSQNIEVIGASHLSLGAYPTSVYLIATLLKQPEDSWRRFKPSLLNKLFYN